MVVRLRRHARGSVELILDSLPHATRTVLGRDAAGRRPAGRVGLALTSTCASSTPTAPRSCGRLPRAQPAPPRRPAAAARRRGGDAGRLRGRRARIGIVTSKMRPAVDVGLRLVPLGEFDAIVTCEDTDRHKPDPAPVLHGLALLGADPGTAVYVGDSPYDVRAAPRAGVRRRRPRSGATLPGGRSCGPSGPTASRPIARRRSRGEGRDARVAELRRLIDEANHQYYVLDAPSRRTTRVRRLGARAAGDRGRAPRARHAGLADAARGRRAVDPVRPGRAPPADALARERAHRRRVRAWAERLRRLLDGEPLPARDRAEDRRPRRSRWSTSTAASSAGRRAATG